MLHLTPEEDHPLNKEDLWRPVSACGRPWGGLLVASGTRKWSVKSQGSWYCSRAYHKSFTNTSSTREALCGGEFSGHDLTCFVGSHSRGRSIIKPGSTGLTRVDTTLPCSMDDLNASAEVNSPGSLYWRNLCESGFIAAWFASFLLRTFATHCFNRTHGNRCTIVQHKVAPFRVLNQQSS